MNIICIILICIVFLVLFLYINFRVIFTSKYNVHSVEIPKSFDGFRIVHLSDLHDAQFGRNNDRLISKVKKLKPDIIVFTGDMVVRQKNNIDKSLAFVDRLDFCDVYFIMGNHEQCIAPELKDKLLDYMKTKPNFHILDNGICEKLVREDGEIPIYGIRFNFHLQPRRGKLKNDFLDRCTEIMRKWMGDFKTEKFNILLAHDPLDFVIYQRLGFDLIYSGHLHGGGINLFGTGVATHRKWWAFTRLASGISTRNGSTIIVSRGLGNSTLPVRVFNPPEISLTVLHSGDKRK